MTHYPKGVPVNCSLCQWEATAINYDEACRLADDHLEAQHKLMPETGQPPRVWRFYSKTDDVLPPEVWTDSDKRLMRMLKIKES